MIKFADFLVMCDQHSKINLWVGGLELVSWEGEGGGYVFDLMQSGRLLINLRAWIY